MYTSNDTWESKFLEISQDITYKIGKIKHLSIFLDYDEANSKEPSLVFSNPNVDIDRLKNDKESIFFKNILRDEFLKRTTVHKYILNDFNLEARVVINKKP